MKLLAAVLYLLIFSMSQAQTEPRGVLLGDAIRRREVLRSDSYRFAPQLVDLLRDGDPKVRAKAAAAFAEIDLYWDEKDRADDKAPSDEELNRRTQIRDLAAKQLAMAAEGGDPQVRDAAVRALTIVLRFRNWGEHGEAFDDPRLLRPLVKLGPSIRPILVSEVRSKEVPASAKINVVRVLSRWKSPEALDAILGQFAEAKGALLSVLMDAAAEYDDPRVAPAIIRFLREKFADYVGGFGVSALIKMKQRAVPAILLGLQEAHDPEVRRNLLLAACGITDPRLLPSTIRALGDECMVVRYTAAKGLGTYVGRESDKALIICVTHETESAVCVAALQSLGERKAQAAIPTLRKLVRDPGSRLRGEALLSLVKIKGAAAVHEILPLARDPELWSAFVSAVASFPDTHTIPALLQIIRKGDGYPVKRATEVLAQMGIEEAFPILLARLRSEPSLDIGDALNFFGPKKVNELLAFFPDAGAYRGRVLTALGGSHSPKALDLLLSKVDDPEVGVDAVSALGKLGDRRAIPRLISLLSSPDDEMAARAAQALGKVGTQSEAMALSAAIERPYVGRFALAAIAKIGWPQNLDLLLKRLADVLDKKDGYTYGPAFEQMGKYRDARVLDFLLDVLEFGPCEVSAAKALGEFGDSKALPLLEQAANSEDSELAEAAQAAIRAIKAKVKGTSSTSECPSVGGEEAAR